MLAKQRRGIDVHASKYLAKNEALLSVAKFLQQHGKSLGDYDGMPQPNMHIVNKNNNGLLMEELVFDACERANLSMHMVSTLNE